MRCLAVMLTSMAAADNTSSSFNGARASLTTVPKTNLGRQ